MYSVIDLHFTLHFPICYCHSLAGPFALYITVSQSCYQVRPLLSGTQYMNGDTHLVDNY